jgi:hypothetical protein
VQDFGAEIVIVGIQERLPGDLAAQAKTIRCETHLRRALPGPLLVQRWAVDKLGRNDVYRQVVLNQL